MKEILKVELETEFRRFIELENYTGLVLVLPDNLNSVVEFVIDMEDYTTLGIHWVSTYNKFVFKESQLYVKVVGESPDWYVRSCSGLLLSSAIIDVECFGGTEKGLMSISPLFSLYSHAYIRTTV